MPYGKGGKTPARLQGLWAERAGVSVSRKSGGDVPNNDLFALRAEGRHGASCHADFLWSSSPTSSNSASTTSSEPAAAAASASEAGPSEFCWAAYIASPSFMEAWISVWVLAAIT